ncbi:MAG TPA: ClpXP protease specificity-enhancing factor SspB [Polyangia bacterium]|nr:ClpXP protease specificity-enhancing factor SspB [Polyangia bacterium]
MNPERPPKQQAFLALLKEGSTSLHLDARRPGVVVPEAFRQEAHLMLQYGYDLAISIPDLEVDDHGVRATLSFSRTPHLTVIPWTAVYAIASVDGRGVLYPEDVPSDVSVMSGGDPAEASEAPQPIPAEVATMGGKGSGDGVPEASIRRLRSIPAHPEAELAEPMAAPMAARRRRRPQLRLVK